MKRTFTIIALSGIAAMALALSSYNKTFDEVYKVKKDSNLGKAACTICHASAKGGKLNAYGKDVKAAMKEAGAKKVTAAVLKSVEKLDSNKDGTKNGEQIKNDENPGK